MKRVAESTDQMQHIQVLITNSRPIHVFLEENLQSVVRYYFVVVYFRRAYVCLFIIS